MEKETMEIVIKVLADKVDLLEWQLKRANEECQKLRDEAVNLKAEIKRLRKLMDEAEEENENEHI